MDPLPTTFDTLLIGTSLPLSILSAALAASGSSVLHVDPSPSYGSHHLALSIPDLLSLSSPSQSYRPQWLTHTSLSFPSPEIEEDIRRRGREYALALEPMLLPARGKLVQELVSSSMGRQSAFQLLQGLFVASPSPMPLAGTGAPNGIHPSLRASPVPASRESVFSSPSLSLAEKRTLMRFLLWVAADPSAPDTLPSHSALEDPALPLPQFLREQFALSGELVEALTYAVALCSRPQDPAIPALRTIRQHLLSSGRYGPSPYLFGHYGGAGELVQLFCRMSAVHGTPYILGHDISSLSLPRGPDEPGRIQVDGIEETFTARRVVLEPLFTPSSPDAEQSTTYRAGCIAVLEATVEELDTALLVFPPRVLGDHLPGGGGDKAVTAFWTGEGSRSCPAGKYVVYLSVPCDTAQDARPLLEPYLAAFIRLTSRPEQEPLMTFYYTLRCHGGGGEGVREVGEGVWMVHGPGDALVDGAERAAGVARELWEKLGGGMEGEMWEGVRDRQEEEDGEDDGGEEEGQQENGW